jgi:hypothetical protein
MNLLRVPSQTSGTSSRLPPTRTTTSNRLPKPTLFQGPPSRNASAISLTLPGAKAAAIGVPAPTQANQSLGQQPPQVPRYRIPELRGSIFSRPPVSGEAKNENDRADALWDEMQNTLAEVELSASNGSHVFTSEHAKVLEDLRTAQLALAQAWARSEADELDNHHPEHENLDAKLGGSVEVSPTAKRGKEGRDDSPSRVNKNLEEETERDIQLSRKRREANDRYFQRVNSGVLDVVAKLEEVATAMRQVEKESREIWSESDGSGSGESVTDTTNTASRPGMRG